MKPGMSFIEASASFVDPSVSFVEADVDSDDAVAVQKRWEELGGSAKARRWMLGDAILERHGDGKSFLFFCGFVRFKRC